MLRVTLAVLLLLFAAPSWAQDCDPNFIGPRLPDDPCLSDERFSPDEDPFFTPERCEEILNDDGWVEGDFAMAINEPTACWKARDNLQGICFNSRCAGCEDVQCRCTCIEPPALISGKVMCVCTAQGRLCPDIPEECRRP